jgi:hypothetical protein
VAYNASRYKEQVDETIAFLSETILHFELLTSRDLKGVVDEERLEGFYFTGIKLSAAIVECLTVAIKLITSMFEGNRVFRLLLIFSIDECHHDSSNEC